MGISVAFCRLCGDVKGWGGPTSFTGTRCTDCLPDRTFGIVNVTTEDEPQVTTDAPHNLTDEDVVSVAGVNGNQGREVAGIWEIKVVDKVTFALVGCETLYRYKGGGVVVAIEDHHMEIVDTKWQEDEVPLVQERLQLEALTAVDQPDPAHMQALADLHDKQKQAVFDAIADTVQDTMAQYADVAMRVAAVRGLDAPVVSPQAAVASLGVKTAPAIDAATTAEVLP